MPEDSLETQELQEKLEDALEKAEKAGEEKASPPWTLYLSLSTAVIAVMAAIAALQAGSLANEALIIKNDAVLAQARASDQWSYYQAKGIKGIVYLTQADSFAGRSPALAAAYREEAKKYKSEQGEIKAQAEEIQKKVLESNEASEHLLHRHHQFALSVTLFQVAIALSAIAALSRRRPMWYLSLFIAAGAIWFSAKGFF